MQIQFKKAIKHKIKARMAIDGPAGAGKTMSCLKIATALCPGGRIAVIDTERQSASLYANLFDFDVVELETFDPRLYVEAIQAAGRAKYDAIIVDSLSHAWSGAGGALDKAGGKFGNWREVTPMHNALVDALLTVPAHVFVTMRTHTEYLVTEEDLGNGRKKQKVERVGLKPVQRAGSEYEFSVVGDMTLDNVMTISKSRCPTLQGRSFLRPGEDVAKLLKEWLEDGEPAPTAPREEPSREPPPMPTAETAAAAQAVADAAAEAALVDERIRQALAAATSPAEVDAIVEKQMAPLKLAKESPRRAPLVAAVREAKARIAAGERAA